MHLTMDKPDLWLRRFHGGSSPTSRVICFPHAGASASYYFPISKALSPDVDMIAVQYPGRQDRSFEECRTSVAQLADEVTHEIRQLTDIPVTIFGHSLGATLGYEVARRLESDGVMISALFSSGQRAPSDSRDEGIHLLDDDALIENIRALGGTDSRLLENDEIMRMVLPTIRSDYMAAETYRYQPGPKLGCPLFTLVGEGDPLVSVEDARAWAVHTTGNFQLRTFPGGHFYLNSHFPAVVELISTHLKSQTNGAVSACQSDL